MGLGRKLRDTLLRIEIILISLFLIGISVQPSNADDSKILKLSSNKIVFTTSEVQQITIVAEYKFPLNPSDPHPGSTAVYIANSIWSQGSFGGVDYWLKESKRDSTYVYNFAPNGKNKTNSERIEISCQWCLDKYYIDIEYQYTLPTPTPTKPTPTPTKPTQVKCSGPTTANANSTILFKCEANQKLKSSGSELISIYYKSTNGLWTWFDDVWDIDDYMTWQTKAYFTINALNDFGKDWNYNGSKIQLFRWEQSKEGSDTETLWVSNIIKVSVKGKGSSGSAPQGTINRKSNSYKLMYNVGKNIARVSTPSDSAKSQCTSAKNSGFIKQNGRMNHLGSQFSFIQSHLRTASGYQGCIDGFNSL
jgi:hypothetical protein